MRKIVFVFLANSFGRAILICLLLATVVGTGLYVRSGRTETNLTSSDVEVELVTLQPYGIEPAEIERPKGPFVLLVDDRTGRETSSLTIQRVTGDRVRELKTNNRKSELYDVLDLPPGKYVLTNAATPEASCQITIHP